MLDWDDIIISLPESPGVYQFLRKKKPLYIGKAKNLKNRVSSYRNTPALSDRIKKMTLCADELIFTITNSETEALWLEADLIHKRQPMYNILLRQGMWFYYLGLDKDPRAPCLRIVGPAQPRKDFQIMMGPFGTQNLAQMTKEAILRAFPLRTCGSHGFAEAMNKQRPCVLYQLKQCSGPCIMNYDKYNFVMHKEYADIIAQFHQWLYDDTPDDNSEVLNTLKIKISELSARQQYEQAARVHDRYKALLGLKEIQKNFHKYDTKESVDVIFPQNNGNLSYLTVLMFRDGFNCNTQTFSSFERDQETLVSLIMQFYVHHPIPQYIHYEASLHDQIWIDTLKQKNKKCTILPLSIDHTVENIMNIVRQTTSKQSSETETLDKSWEKIFNWTDIKTVEVYDNSHWMGDAAVGGFVRYDYEKSHLKSATVFDLEAYQHGGDDYELLRTVLKLRCQKGKLPDIFVIDGGWQHLCTAREILAEILQHHNTKIISLSKGPNRVAGTETYWGEYGIVDIPQGHEIWKRHMEKLRDAIHNGVIQAHRKKLRENRQQ